MELYYIKGDKNINNFSSYTEIVHSELQNASISIKRQKQNVRL
jgi:hypothetical protein